MKRELAFAFPMTSGGDTEAKAATAVSPADEAASVEERLIEVDISVTLEQYRKVRARMLEDEFSPIPETGQREQALRRSKLQDYAERLRAQAIDHGAKLRKLRDDRRANSSSGE